MLELPAVKHGRRWWAATTWYGAPGTILAEVPFEAHDENISGTRDGHRWLRDHRAFAPSEGRAMLDHHQRPDAIMPDSINLLDEILSQLLTERGLGRDCEDAELVATRLIFLFRSGVRARDVLRNWQPLRDWENSAQVILCHRHHVEKHGVVGR
ncbi:hypothetical protein [Sinorhizobium meliloti]|uniref:hypothetical protein n=1 Tax=Rhizobium meliloti TaxID=382 RepID=UPI001F188729|nr:hypothetical protein [Sinorhizobium meliloti]